MSAAGERELTASQEDYLEAIWTLIWTEGVARVRDIADSLGVSMPSVTGALKTLVKHKLVEHRPHKYVTLSERGMELAERISARHAMLRKLLTDVLGVKAELADGNACRIEHAVDEVVSRRLSYFVEFILQGPRAAQWPQEFKAFCARQEAAEADRSRTTLAAGTSPDDAKAEETGMTLADVKPGQKARIVRVNATAATNRRLVVMGMTRNAVVSVVRIAPLGDPIEIKIRGYSLSLRKGQARGIAVEALA